MINYMDFPVHQQWHMAQLEYLRERKHLYLVPDNEHRAREMEFLLRQEQKQYYNKKVMNLESGRHFLQTSKIDSWKPVRMDGRL